MQEILINKELKDKAKEKKIANINSLSNLEKGGLQFNNVERRILAYTTAIGEKIYIQYPGKESARESRTRPWDFRPKLELPNGTYMPDLSFKMIWDDIVKMEQLNKKELFNRLAAYFYRMAMMVDNEYTKKEYTYYDIDMNSNSVVNSGTIELEWYQYFPHNEDLQELKEYVSEIRGVSLEAYLVYNDLLAQNEDCKYYYRDVIENGKNWDGKIGRFNNLMTHISIIQYLLKEISFTQVVDKFQRGQGVAPASEKDLSAITNGIINK